MKQSPAPGEYLLKWRGDFIEVTLALPSPRKGRALLRTDIGGAKERRAEIIAEAEQDIPATQEIMIITVLVMVEVEVLEELVVQEVVLEQ